MLSPLPTLPPPCKRAFSLVEVAMAIGIVAFSLVAILALLPLGMNRFRQAMDSTVGAQIAQRVLSDAEQTDFDSLIKSAESSNDRFFVLPIRYFDEQGTEVIPKSDRLSVDDAAAVIYQVRIRCSQPGPADAAAPGRSFTSLPAAQGGTRFRPRDAIFLTVQIAYAPGGANFPVNDDDLWVPPNSSVSVFTSILTRNGYPRNTPL